MVKVLEGQIKSKGKHYGIVASRFNELITERLLEACLKEFKRCGVKKDEITVVWVPGSFEIPVAALRLAKRKSVSAVICLGAVIRGETAHFDLIAQAAAQGIAQVALLTGKPAVFGVLTTDNLAQAKARSEPNGENKGRDAARNAIEMADLLRKY